MRRVIPYCSVHLDARMIPPRCVIHDFGCRLHLDARPISLMSVFLFVQRVARYGSVISYRSVHLDARLNHARNVIHHLSGIHDFVQQVARYGSVILYCSVHLDARPNHARNIIQPFRVFTISCNKLHATGLHHAHNLLQ